VQGVKEITIMNEQEKDRSTIAVALVAARSGGASVPQLARAHELAEKHGLHNTTAEIRGHLRNIIPDPNSSAFAYGRSLVIGVSAGFITHFLLRITTMRRAGHA
jgi:hypothetical protein